MKKTAALGCIAAFWAIVLCGCRLISVEEEPRTPLEYKIVEQKDVPQELQELIEEKKARDFQLTYRAEDDLYLVRGYGQQLTGGCSIQVKEVSASSNAIFFNSRLVGPNQDEISREPSYPYIVIKTEGRNGPVEFDVEGEEANGIEKR